MCNKAGYTGGFSEASLTDPTYRVSIYSKISVEEASSWNVEVKIKDPFTVIILCSIQYFPLTVTDREKNPNYQYYRNIPWSGRLAHFKHSDINRQLKWTRRSKISINLLISKCCLSRTSHKMTQMIIIIFCTRELETFSIVLIKKGLFLSVSWMNPKTDGLEMECVLDDDMNFVQRLSLVLQSFPFASDSYISSYFLV